MKLTKQIYGAPDGEIYPRTFDAGEDCPPGLEAAAQSMGALDKPERPEDKPAQVAEPKTKAKS